jgi:hypothetical protein
MLVLMPGSGLARRALGPQLTIGPIQAVFSEADRATTYSVERVVESPPDPVLHPTYRWDLTLEPVDPNVPVDDKCINHGVMHGTGATFVWHHGNKGDPVHDDGCSHSIYGKYGHQGLITVVVTSHTGWQCQETYKGTFSSNANSVANGVASRDVCQRVSTAAPQPACRCFSLTARILSSSFSMSDISARKPRFGFAIHFLMTCGPGSGGCNGTLGVVAPEQAANKKAGDSGYRTEFLVVQSDVTRPETFQVVQPLRCVGECAKLNEGVFHIWLQTVDGLAAHQRASESIPILIKRTCQGKQVRPIRLSIAFDGSGRFDPAKSTLH